MATRKYGNSWWVDFTFNRQRVRKRSPMNTRKGAREYEATLRGRLGRGEPVKGAPMAPQAPSLEEFVPRCTENHVLVNNKRSEVRTKEKILRIHLLPFFGEMDLNQIGTEDVERFKATKKASGLSPKYINNMLSVLSSCLRSAREWDVPDSDPRIRWLKTQKPAVKYLNEQEEAKLSNDGGTSVFNDMLLLALRTGLRQGELHGLQWGDIDLERRVLTVQHNAVDGQVSGTKGWQLRHVDLLPDVHDMLTHRPHDGKFVFPNTSGQLLHPSTSRKGLAKICDRAGVKRVGWHALRHTFCTRLAERGAPDSVIQSLMGHSDIRVTMRYTHVSDKVRYMAMMRLIPQGENEAAAIYGQSFRNPHTHNQKYTVNTV